jgi:hypothetical protein
MLRGALATLFLDLHDLADRSPYEQLFTTNSPN